MAPKLRPTLNSWCTLVENERGSQDDALGAALTVLSRPAVASILLSVVVVILVFGRATALARRRIVALGITRWWRVRSLLAQLSHNVEERRLHVDAVFRRCLDELTIELFCKGAAFLCGNFSFGHAVALVADKHDGSWSV